MNVKKKFSFVIFAGRRSLIPVFFDNLVNADLLTETFLS